MDSHYTNINPSFPLSELFFFWKVNGEGFNILPLRYNINQYTTMENASAHTCIDAIKNVAGQLQGILEQIWMAILDKRLGSR